jgi:hypothetical protein
MEICALLGHYAASSGNSIPTFRDNLSVPPSRVKKSKKRIHFLNLEDVTDRLSQNVGTEFTALPCVIFQKSADLMSTARVVKAVLLRKSGDENNPEMRGKRGNNV